MLQRRYKRSDLFEGGRDKLKYSFDCLHQMFIFTKTDYFRFPYFKAEGVEYVLPLVMALILTVCNQIYLRE